MKSNAVLVVASLLSILLLTLHVMSITDRTIEESNQVHPIRSLSFQN